MGIAWWGAGWRRRVAGACVWLAAAGVALAASQPSIGDRTAGRKEILELVVDVSGSTQATDVIPTRLSAIQRSLLRLLDQLPPRVQVGVVSFSGSATSLARPTSDRAPSAGRSHRCRQTAPPRSATRSSSRWPTSRPRGRRSRPPSCWSRTARTRRAATRRRRRERRRRCTYASSPSPSAGPTGPRPSSTSRAASSSGSRSRPTRPSCRASPARPAAAPPRPGRRPSWTPPSTTSPARPAWSVSRAS